MNNSNSNPVYGMMSQGVNVVLAKTLLNMECKQNQAIALIDAAWDDKLCSMKFEYDQKIESQANEMKMLRNEIRQMKDFIFGKSDCGVSTNLCGMDEVQYEIKSGHATSEQVHGSSKEQELAEIIKESNKKIGELEEVTSFVQDFVEDFVKVYECRNGLVDSVITKHENDLKSSRDAIGSINAQVQTIYLELSAMERKVIRHIDLLPMKLDEYVNDLKKSNEMYVSIDEHNQLRINLEDQIMGCDIKCDHVLLTAQQQWEEYKRRSEGMEVVTGVLARAKKRRESTLVDIETKYRVLTESIENESKTAEIFDYVDQVDETAKQCNVRHRDSRKVHFFVEIDDQTRDEVNENTESTIQHYDIDDNESEFENSTGNLVLLDEHSIH